MSVIKDLLLLDRNGIGSGNDAFAKYLLKKLKKHEIQQEQKKKDQHKHWSFEDRVCLGLLIAFGILPLALLYRWGLHILAAG
jgi:hypothetical protein